MTTKADLEAHARELESDAHRAWSMLRRLARLVRDGQHDAARELATGVLAPTRAATAMRLRADGTVVGAGWAVELLAEVLVEQLRTLGAENLCEWKLKLADGRALTLTAQWLEGKSPMDLVAEARAERDAVLGELGRERAVLSHERTLRATAELDRDIARRDLAHERDRCPERRAANASDDVSADYLVTAAILRAEQLSREGSADAPAAWTEVSRLEGRLAAEHPADSVEGATARVGAVTAAVRAGQLDLVRDLAARYAADPALAEGRRAQIAAAFTTETSR